MENTNDWHEYIPVHMRYVKSVLIPSLQIIGGIGDGISISLGVTTEIEE